MTHQDSLVTATQSAMPQVVEGIYDWKKYMSPDRWCSFWHQVDLIVAQKPRQVLEVGGGNGLLRSICRTLGIDFRMMDIREDSGPDLVGSVLQIPLEDRSVDLSCAFQMLEHIPYQDSLVGFRELCRVARRDVIISLPNATRAFPVSLLIPRVFTLRCTIPGFGLPLHRMVKSHYWEIGQSATKLRKVIADFSAEARLVKTFRVFENPYHQFFHFSKE
jgi:ubiquinone/menaquinone biosynthesis C-methylase UbiE